MKSMATSTNPHFTPIEEGNEEEEFSPRNSTSSYKATPFSNDSSTKNDAVYRHKQTPLHNKKQNDESSAVSCNKCRPSNREKISIVPLENNNINNNGRNSSVVASPNGLFKSIISSISLKKSPKNSSLSLSSGASSFVLSSRDEHWKIVVAELSNKVVQASRKRDEAILEASKLKHSMSELEKKLNKLEIYCHSLKSGLEICSNSNGSISNGSVINRSKKTPVNIDCHFVKVGDQEKVIQHFLVMVSEARSSVRGLSRVLGLQIRHMGGKVYERVSSLLQDYDIKVSFSRNPRGLLCYVEALLSRAFYEEFESVGFCKGGVSLILNPIDRCEANFAMFSRLQGLTWEEVLGKGTKHFSEDFSKFCDRKMSEIVAMLGWSRAWPEPLLQAFFGASKAVWLVHLLANSVHPGLPIFRVDKGVGFDPVYMEDMGGDKARKLVPAMVRIMVTPGFYVYNNVVKCKVLCRYYGSVNNGGGNVYDHLSDKGFTPSPS